MTPRAMRGGAYVSVRPSDIPAWTDAKARRMFRLNTYRMESYGGLTGAQLAKVSKPSRQRRKGPIVRFGGRTS